MIKVAMYKLRLLYHGNELAPVLSFSEKEIEDSLLLPVSLRELFLETKRQRKSLLEYEVGEYDDAPDDSPLSGATMEEVRRALGYIADFYRRRAQQGRSEGLEEERTFKELTFRMRRVVLLMLDFIGPKDMLSMWTKMFADSLIGKSKEEMMSALFI